MGFETLRIDPEGGAEGRRRVCVASRGQGHPADREVRARLARLELESALSGLARLGQAIIQRGQAISQPSVCAP